MVAVAKQKLGVEVTALFSTLGMKYEGSRIAVSRPISEFNNGLNGSFPPYRFCKQLYL